jgi:hypothetical protein
MSLLHDILPNNEILGMFNDEQFETKESKYEELDLPDINNHEELKNFLIYLFDCLLYGNSYAGDTDLDVEDPESKLYNIKLEELLKLILTNNNLKALELYYTASRSTLLEYGNGDFQLPVLLAAKYSNLDTFLYTLYNYMLYMSGVDRFDLEYDSLLRFSHDSQNESIKNLVKGLEQFIDDDGLLLQIFSDERYNEINDPDYDSDYDNDEENMILKEKYMDYYNLINDTIQNNIQNNNVDR